jgi:hypothetical protein
LTSKDTLGAIVLPASISIALSGKSRVDPRLDPTGQRRSINFTISRKAKASG